jgi:uncharacterized membrane protein YtjA (UPF0391 family)
MCENGRSKAQFADELPAGHGLCYWRGRRKSMLYYALVFLIVGLVAGALGIYGVASVASQIAWVLFVIAIVLFILHSLGGRRVRL